VWLVRFAAFLGIRVTPRVLDRAAHTQSRELFTLTVLVSALGIAVSSALIFGVSMALGAFLAGMIVGRSEFSLRAASEALPMRDAFAVLFFVSVGMLFDPRHLIDAPGLTAATLGVVVLGKPLIAFAVVLFLRQPPKVGLAVSVSLAQIGEFSFMLALLGTQLGVLPAAATNTLVAAAIVSILINPLLYRGIDRFAAKAARRSTLWRWLERRARARVDASAPTDGAATQPGGSHRAIVVGYGPVGETVTRLLAENEIKPTVVELNVETIRRLRKQGIAAVYGDASQRETLKTAGIESAGSLILSSSSQQGAPEVIRLARELNPSVRVLARAAYLRDLPALKRAGAEAVVAGESEVAISLTVAILQQLGATPEQIDRERARVHDDLLAPHDGKPG
jgi:CPA2 family monovalent cation:H+ antiporter-2